MRIGRKSQEFTQEPYVAGFGQKQSISSERILFMSQVVKCAVSSLLLFILNILTYDKDASKTI